MFESLKSALGLTPEAQPASGVDALTHRRLQDLNLPDPTPADAAAPRPDQRDPLVEAQEVVTDGLNEGQDVDQPLDIVFEALFDTQAKAASYLAHARGLALEGYRSDAMRNFVNSIAATIVVKMIAAPEELVRIEQALSTLAVDAGGIVDGYYLEGHADG